MVDYKKMYLTLFNAMEDAINTMENARQALIQAQRECEAADEESESGGLTVLSAT